MSQEPAPVEKRSSRFTIPPWVLSSLGSMILSGIARWLWKRIAPRLRQALSMLDIKKIWPVVVAATLLLAGGTARIVTNQTKTIFWNFPCNSPCPHLSLYVIPILDNLTTAWIGAFALSILYCSRNYLKQFRWGTLARNLSRSLMFIMFLLYPAIVAWFSLAAEGSFLIPAWAQTPFWLGASYPLGLMVVRSGEAVIEAVLGRRMFGKQGILTSLGDGLLGAGAIGMRLIGDSLAGNYRRLVYPRLTSQTIEVPVKHDVRPAILSFIFILTVVSTTLAWRIGLTSMYDLFNVFATVLWGLVVSSVILGWRKKLQDSEKEKHLTRVPKRLWSKFRFFSRDPSY